MLVVNYMMPSYLQRRTQLLIIIFIVAFCAAARTANCLQCVGSRKNTDIYYSLFDMCMYSATAADNFSQRFDDVGSVVQPTSCCLEERLQDLYGRVINDEEVRNGAVHVTHV